MTASKLQAVTSMCISALHKKDECKHKSKSNCICQGEFNLAIRILHAIGLTTAQIKRLI